MDFRIIGLPSERFAHLFELSDAELAEHGAVRRIADARSPGYPCRISLTDSEPGDELLLVNFEHHAIATPYRMRYAIYVRRGEVPRFGLRDGLLLRLRLRQSRYQHRGLRTWIGQRSGFGLAGRRNAYHSRRRLRLVCRAQLNARRRRRLGRSSALASTTRPSCGRHRSGRRSTSR